MLTKKLIVETMKLSILNDVKQGFVPLSVRNFGDLHDHVDANCYGGFCDDSIADSLIEQFGGRDEDERMPDGMIMFMNECQDEVSEWIRRGGMANAAEAMTRAASVQPPTN